MEVVLGSIPTAATATAATSRLTVALRWYPIRAIAGIWDTCIHVNFVPELGSRFHWLIQWRRSNKYAAGDRPTAFQD
jgi:hypothetical protein